MDPTGLGDVAGEYDKAGNLLSPSTSTAGTVWSAGSTRQRQAAYYDFDALGSTVGLTGTTGGYVNQYSYLPFGEQLSASESVANPFKYVGQIGVMEESNGLDFMRTAITPPPMAGSCSRTRSESQAGSISTATLVTNRLITLIPWGSPHLTKKLSLRTGPGYNRGFRSESGRGPKLSDAQSMKLRPSSGRFRRWRYSPCAATTCSRGSDRHHPVHPARHSCWRHCGCWASCGLLRAPVCSRTRWRAVYLPIPCRTACGTSTARTLKPPTLSSC